MGKGKGRVDRWGKREASQREEEGGGREEEGRGRREGGGGRAPREQLAEVSVRSGELLRAARPVGVS